MYSSNELKELVERSLKGILHPEGPSELYAPVSYSLSVGGKRIRPVLALLACNMFTDHITDKCVLPAIGLEMFHTFTLVHDDIMDKADMRRNQASVHKKWNSNIAILSGDAMCIDAYRLMCQAEISKLPEILACFNKAALNVCEGQQYDMNYEAKSSITENDYLKMIELKTGKLIAVAAQIGAILGGASTPDVDKLYKVGLNLGMAFQIQDDVLDTYSDSKKLGKDAGLDIAHNKKTYLLISAIRLAAGEQKKQLNILLKPNTEIDPKEKYLAVKSIYDELKVRDLAEAKIKEYFSKAASELNGVGAKPERKQAMEEFVNQLITRQS
ncbi:MAG: polyprenyl synthetase family protein [Prevotellaceae bacterium]|jgi:geranylgeranyl diphosphate synthase type II|nr:polyprenyl synthetase family protein [Prevotellaceae bacterium]